MDYILLNILLAATCLICERCRAWVFGPGLFFVEVSSKNLDSIGTVEKVLEPRRTQKENQG